MINWLQNFKMPDPLMVIGFMYIIVALFYLIRLIKNGELKNISPHIFNNLRSKYLIGIAIFIVFSVYFIDQPLSQFFFDIRTPIIANLLNFVNSLGEGWFVAGGLLTILIISEIRNKEQLGLNTKMALVALIYAGVINTVLKVFFNRQRPSINLADQFAFFSFFQSKEHNIADLIYASNSFPSGHSITVFAVITPFLLFAKSKSLKIWALGYALLVCFARVYTQNHWLSDVVVGATLGIIIGTSVYQVHLKKFTNDSK